MRFFLRRFLLEDRQALHALAHLTRIGLLDIREINCPFAQVLAHTVNDHRSGIVVFLIEALGQFLIRGKGEVRADDPSLPFLDFVATPEQHLLNIR